MRKTTPARLTALALVAAAGLTGCAEATTGGDGDDSTQEVLIGYFPNITHATAIVAEQEGYFDEQLAEVDAEPGYQQFNSGTDAYQAVQDGSLAMSFIGPGPALTAFVQGPDSVRVVSGAASGGAALVVQDDIQDLADLEGERVATPSLGNTQDVAARAYFLEEGYETDLEGGGDINIVPTDNPVAVNEFRDGNIAGAWVPEPWASILVAEGGRVLVDEADIWPETDGQFVTTHLLVNAEFLEENPDQVKAVLKATVAANDFIETESDTARDEVGARVTELTDAPIEPEVLADAWDNLTFTNDPIAPSLEQDAVDAGEVELLDGLDDAPPVTDIYDLTLLNEVLSENGDEEVPAP
ncbi:ABC transporter substrate-binding protein [Nocardioides sp. CFH 31398]|uniref:ABC transporter substrate-binding protein n=1 Tax=Nocardioides sp. CFH 31398 TaxID=2919579 RepID=UPI001F067344|nr:ABC transporter substrate-binding protein [Nocardioides sp. CFH 31398]MCH1865045.1 ABC transporter substrate-binding protein [Nocardioides sp. CFH 31398]